MKIHKGTFYLSNLEGFSYIQRLFYVVANYLRPDWSILGPNLNPIDWCFRDAIKLVYLVVLFAIIYPFALIPWALYEAHSIRTRYIGADFDGYYKARTYWMEIDK